MKTPDSQHLTNQIAIARKVLGELYGGISQGWVFLAGEALGWGKEGFNLADPTALDRMAERAVELGDVRATIAVFKTRASQRSANFLAARCVMCDFDGGRNLLPFARPTMEIASGGETDGRRHIHTLKRMYRPVRDAAEFAELQRGDRDALGGDAGWNGAATALFRIPGTVHRKGGRVRKVELIAHRPERIFAVSDLRRHHRRQRPEQPQVVDLLTGELVAAMKAVADRRLAEVGAGASRENTGFEIARDWHLLGVTKDSALDAAADWHPRVTEIAERDHPYELDDLLGSVQRRYAGGARPSRADAVDDWEKATQADSKLSPSQKTLISSVAGRMRAAGSKRVTASIRQLAVDGRMSVAAVDRALHGSKRHQGLHGSYLAKAGKGEKGAQRWKLRHPRRGEGKESTRLAPKLDSPSAITTSISPFPVACSHSVPPNSDGWSYCAIGHGARLVFDVLAFLNRPLSAVELTSSPVLSDHPRTIRRQLRRLEDHGLARRLPDSRWEADLEDVEAKLDAAAEALGTAGRADRMHRIHERERVAFREDQARFAVEQDRKRQVEAENRMRRVCSRRHRNPRRMNVNESAYVSGRRFTVPRLPPNRRSHLPLPRSPTHPNERKQMHMPPLLRPRPVGSG
jgi:hypothetical protein